MNDSIFTYRSTCPKTILTADIDDLVVSVWSRKKFRMFPKYTRTLTMPCNGSSEIEAGLAVIKPHL